MTTVRSDLFTTTATAKCNEAPYLSHQYQWDCSAMACDPALFGISVQSACSTNWQSYGRQFFQAAKAEHIETVYYSDSLCKVVLPPPSNLQLIGQHAKTETCYWINESWRKWTVGTNSVNHTIYVDACGTSGIASQRTYSGCTYIQDSLYATVQVFSATGQLILSANNSTASNSTDLGTKNNSNHSVLIGGTTGGALILLGIIAGIVWYTRSRKKALHAAAGIVDESNSYNMNQTNSKPIQHIPKQEPQQVYMMPATATSTYVPPEINQPRNTQQLAKSEKASFLNQAYQGAAVVNQLGYSSPSNVNEKGAKKDSRSPQASNDRTSPESWSVERTAVWAATIPQVGPRLERIVLEHRLRFENLTQLSREEMQRTLRLSLGECLDVERAIVAVTMQDGISPPEYSYSVAME
ncbi:UNVERIFIED_CONTAM: hypothetical protein HDU68_011897 [Siphonaria sp. JEL0065]|nr:hypothetical protein HDU68_011897 [Siphonaria sp. JEL0065]